MRSHNDSIDTTRTPPPLSFYNTFKAGGVSTQLLYFYFTSKKNFKEKKKQ
jgi:hypothetical protein